MSFLVFRAVVLAVLAMATAPALAQTDGGFYLSSELGINFAPGFDFLGNSTDQGSVCDPFVNPDAGSRAAAGCPTMGTGWKSVFDSGRGILGGVAVGYGLGGFPNRLLKGLRVELEYVFRESVFDQTSPILSQSGVARDKLNDEIYRAEEHIGSLTSHNVFGNVYYDFANGSRLTPYIGLGAGFGVTDLDNGRIWARNHDWRQINTARDLPNGEEVRRNLAGTTSSLHASDRETLFGYQLLVGVDVALTDAVSVGLKGRWAHFGTMRYDGTLDMLRSHDVPEGYVSRREVDGIALIAVSGNLKYRF